MQKWIVSCSQGHGLFWHIQARTADQLSSFVCLASDEVNIYKGKTDNGKLDIFTLTEPRSGSTMNVVGKIEYEGTWPKMAGWRVI